MCTLVSGDDKTHVGKNRDYFSDEKSVAHLLKAKRGPMTFAIDGRVQGVSLQLKNKKNFSAPSHPTNFSDALKQS